MELLNFGWRTWKQFEHFCEGGVDVLADITLIVDVQSKPTCKKRRYLLGTGVPAGVVFSGFKELIFLFCNRLDRSTVGQLLHVFVLLAVACFQTG